MERNMSEYRQCVRCVFDTNDDEYIKFNKDGICNHCTDYDALAKRELFDGVIAQKKLAEVVDKLKAEGKGKKYDTILGVSGGVDSTYLAFLTKQLNLRVLLFHFDNGWNSELAVKNIENLSTKLDFDLYTYVVNWEEFRDVQLAYLEAGVIDIEAITDHSAIHATKQIAKKFNIKSAIIGYNIVTEAVLPKSWIFPKRDWRNVKDIHATHGKMKLKTFPISSIYEDFYFKYIFKLHFFSLLNYVPYIKTEVKKIISKELDWKDYGGKHYENIWTRFYQGYILPTRFNIDKRKSHLSNLICSKQITKAEAIEELKLPIYNEEQFKIDYEFVLKKLNLTEEQFQHYMKLPIKSHREYDHYMPIEKRYPFLYPVKKIFRKIVKVK